MLAVGKKHSESIAFHYNMGNGKLFILHSALVLVFHTVQCIRSVPMFFAKRLYKSMKVNAPEVKTATVVHLLV